MVDTKINETLVKTDALENFLSHHRSVASILTNTFAILCYLRCEIIEI